MVFFSPGDKQNLFPVVFYADGVADWFEGLGEGDVMVQGIFSFTDRVMVTLRRGLGVIACGTQY
jgi:hypothetical protein